MSFDWLVDLVFPRFCLDCYKFGTYICQNCAESINFYSPQTCPYCELPSPYGLTHPRCQKKFGLDGMFVLAHYDGLVKEIIHRVKYSGEYALFDDLAKIILLKYHYKFKFNYLVPVPLHTKRLEERGFNQAKILANYLSVILASPGKRDASRISKNHDIKRSWTSQDDKWSSVDLLIRTRQTKPQFDLKFHERKRNVAEAFGLSPLLLSNSLTNFSFCLVDDVCTTGSTIFECAKVLKSKGADKVWAIVISRGG